MGRIVDARGEEALDVLADLLEPISAIAGDKEISEITRNNGSVGQLCAAILRRHKPEVVQIMAIDDGKTVDEEKSLLSVVTVPARLLALVSIPAVKEMLFSSAETSKDETGSSAASGKGNE